MGKSPPADQSTRQASLKEIHRISLAGASVEVSTGRDAGLSVSVGPAGIIAGTGTSCDLTIVDDLVSRRHVGFHSEREGVRIVDLGSKNGTFLGGARIREISVTEDTSLILGSTTLTVRLKTKPLEVSFSPRTSFGAAIAHSESLRHVFELLEQAAKTDATVLLEGDSGVGKDVLATAVHTESLRADAPFVVLDCAATPPSLFESELLGHEKGAFTGADQTRPGALEQANGGTLFLDEVGELPLEVQPKLLRALENQSFRRVGGARSVDVNVRIVAATNRRLKEAVRRGDFRSDLFYRLAVVQVTVPSLAERSDDVAPLAEMFLRRATGDDDAKLPADVVRLLATYDWPGNVRELRNVVERFATFNRADPELLFSHHGGDGSSTSKFDFLALERQPYHEAKRRLVDAFHRALLPRVVERAGGSVPRAAELLGIPKASLYRMLQQIQDGEE